MGKYPSMPLFVDDYEADTAHLTLEEDGAYNRLLRLCWRTPGCSIPDDDAWIRRRMRVSQDQYDAVVAPILEEFFERSRGRYFQKRQRAEFGYVSDVVQKRKEAGKKGGLAKSQKTKGNTSSKATILPEQNASKTLAPTPTPTPTPIKKEREGSNTHSKGSRMPSDFVLPKKWGEWAMNTHSLSEKEVRDQAEGFKDYWLGVPGKQGIKLDWEATWRNRIRAYVDRKANTHSNTHSPKGRADLERYLVKRAD